MRVEDQDLRAENLVQFLQVGSEECDWVLGVHRGGLGERRHLHQKFGDIAKYLRVAFHHRNTLLQTPELLPKFLVLLGGVEPSEERVNAKHREDLLPFGNLPLGSNSLFEHILFATEISEYVIVKLLVIFDCRNCGIFGLRGILIVVHVPILL